MPAEFAKTLGVDPAAFEAILDGRASFDVSLAVRLARALQLPAERLMQMQLKWDFARARVEPSLGAVPLWRDGDAAFPAHFLVGHLGRAADTTADDSSIYFQQDVPPGARGGDRYAGLHALWRGDRIRVYDERRAELWSGPILQNLDGRPLLPGVRPDEWRRWFGLGLRADLAFGQEHNAFMEMMDHR